MKLGMAAMDGLEYTCLLLAHLSHDSGNYTVKKKGPRGVRFEGCYSPRSVMATHKGVELTSWGVGRLR